MQWEDVVGDIRTCAADAIKYFVFLWDMDHVSQQIADSNLYGTKQDIVRMIDDTDRKIVFTYVKGPEKNCRSVPTIGFHPPSGRMCLVASQAVLLQKV
jgi:hypothetical protein